jgi:hypothetical protein
MRHSNSDGDATGHRRRQHLNKHRQQPCKLPCCECVQILKWVQKCCAAHPMSGQVCFDFMLNEADGVLYCIECEFNLLVCQPRMPWHRCNVNARNAHPICLDNWPVYNSSQWRRLICWVHAGNPRTSTNLLAFYNDERLPVAFFKPQVPAFHVVVCAAGWHAGWRRISA